MRNEFDIKNLNQNLSNIIDNITKKEYNLELTKEILNEIEYLSLNDYKINIIELDAQHFSDDLYEKQSQDYHWIENNILNKTQHDVSNGFFKHYFDLKEYKNHNNITSMDRSTDYEYLYENNNTKLTNDCLSCGDIIYVDLDCVDFINNEINQLFYIIDTDNKTMQRIAIIGSKIFA